MKEDTKTFFTGLMWGGIATVLALSFSYSCLNQNTRRFHLTERVQSGYIAPSKIEKIVCEDRDKTDGQGLCETYVTINEHEYVLVEDKNGKPKLSTYKVIPEVPAIPAKVVPDDYVKSAESTSEINKYH